MDDSVATFPRLIRINAVAMRLHIKTEDVKQLILNGELGKAWIKEATGEISITVEAYENYKRIQSNKRQKERRNIAKKQDRKDPLINMYISKAMLERIDRVQKALGHRPNRSQFIRDAVERDLNEYLG